MELRRREEARRLAAARRRTDDLAHYGKSSESADGRPHREVQTEMFLEELADHVEDMDVTCQTDAFLDRPRSPLFIPAKTALDASTQIYEGDVSIPVLFALIYLERDAHSRLPAVKGKGEGHVWILSR